MALEQELIDAGIPADRAATIAKSFAEQVPIFPVFLIECFSSSS
tara:strand:+ start:141 stop:272 length:132 start_codon:yes stop_codon:yes gene_type:complete